MSAKPLTKKGADRLFPRPLIKAALKAGSPIWRRYEAAAVTAEQRDELLRKAFTASIPEMSIWTARYAIKMLEAATMLYPEDTAEHLSIERAAWFIERRAKTQDAEDDASALARVHIVFDDLAEGMPPDEREALTMIRRDFVDLMTWPHTHGAGNDQGGRS